MSALEIRLEEARCYELVFPSSRLGAGPSPRGQPGSVRRYADGAAVLHTGPGRWLLVGQAIRQESTAVGAAAVAGGSLLDVSGKWLRLLVTGADAEPCLAQFLSVAQVLHGRGCAPVNVLDCPVLLARCEGGFELWTTRSWAKWLYESLTAALSGRR